MMIRSTRAISSPTSAWKIAECSLSTGRMLAPCRCAVSSSSAPAQTSDSLLASASVVPCDNAAMPGASPAAPTMADMIQSAGRVAASVTATVPAAASTPDPCSAARRSSSRSSCAVTASSAPSRFASSASRSILPAPVSATTS